MQDGQYCQNRYGWKATSIIDDYSVLFLAPLLLDVPVWQDVYWFQFVTTLLLWLDRRKAAAVHYYVWSWAVQNNTHKEKDFVELK